MNKYILTLPIAIVLSIISSVSMADETSHRKAAEALLESINIQQTMIETMDRMVELEIKNNQQLSLYEYVLRKFFKKHVAGEHLIDEFATFYMEEFNEHELIEIANFYKTSTGRKAANKLPILTQKKAIWGQNKVQESLPELKRMIEEETKRLQELKISSAHSSQPIIREYGEDSETALMISTN